MAIKFSGNEALKRAAIKRGIILLHIYFWEFTDAHTIGMLVGLKRTATFTTIQGLIDGGLIASHRVSGCPSAVLHLTPKGASAVQSVMHHDEYTGLHPVVYPSKLNVAHVQHDLLVQRFVIELAKGREGVQVLSTRQIVHSKKEIGRKRLGSSAKIPDAILILRNANLQKLFAIEVQESAESDLVTERKLSQYFEAIQNNEVHTVFYVSTSQARLEQVKRVWNGKLRRWWYNPDKKMWIASHHGDFLEDDEIKKTRFAVENITRLSTGLYQHVIL
jgi:hypothetical protein